MKWYAKRYWFFILLFFCVISLVLPLFLRDWVLIGGESYYNLRLANDFSNYDELSFGGRYFYGESGYIKFLSFNPWFFSISLPILFGIGSFILFYLIVEKLMGELRNIASALLLISPGFLLLFSSSSKYCAAIFFFLLGMYFLLRRMFISAWLIVLIVGLFSIFLSILFFIVMLFIGYRRFLFSFIIGLGLLLEILLQFRYAFYENIWNFGFFNSFSLSGFFSSSISEFGGIIGLFFILLSLIGIYVVYKDGFVYFLVYSGMGLLFTLSFYFDFLYFLLNIFIVYLSAVGLMKLVGYKWGDFVLKRVVVLIFIFGMLFSFIVTIERLDDAKPSRGFLEAMDFLYEWDRGQVVFSHFDRGHYLSYAGMKNVMDSHFYFGGNVEGRLVDSMFLFRSVYIADAEVVLNKYNVRYIWIDGSLIDGLWGRDDIQLLWLLEYSDRFSLIFENEEVKIYQYLRKNGD